jgi:hypothetical protein
MNRKYNLKNKLFLLPFKLMYTFGEFEFSASILVAMDGIYLPAY